MNVRTSRESKKISNDQELIRELKNMTLSNIFAILTFLASCLSSFLENVRLGRHENLSFFSGRP